MKRCDHNKIIEMIYNGEVTIYAQCTECEKIVGNKNILRKNEICKK